MSFYDDETERYLKEFQPRAIRKMKIPRQPRAILRWRWAAVTAAVGLLAAGMVWRVHRQTVRVHEMAKTRPTGLNIAPERRPSLVVLTRLALADDSKLEALWAEESRTVLPAARGKHSTLRVLAGE